MDSIIKIKETRRKCPNGQRWNNKTKKCESKNADPIFTSPIIGKHKKDVVVSSEFYEKYHDKVPSDVHLLEISSQAKTIPIPPMPIPVKTKRRKCPNGQRWNNQTQKCEKPVTDESEAFLLNPVVVKPLKKIKIIKPLKKLVKTPKCDDGQKLNADNKCEPLYGELQIELSSDLSSGILDELNAFAPVKLQTPPEVEPIKKFRKLKKKILIQDTITNETNLNPSPPIPAAIPVDSIDKFKFDDFIGDIKPNSNEYLRHKEIADYNAFLKSGSEFDYLYPDIGDPDFNIKIALRKEFSDTKYDGKIRDIKEYANQMCGVDFELTPHQLFVKNFLSFQTPYNSLFLYHGLGSGKTCSAIGIAEEMRAYMKQVGIKHKIIVVASPNVQDNFRLQLFDDKKLKEENGIWNISSCIGNTLLKEINPTNITGVSKDKIVTQITSIINQYYHFMGYVELANYISNKTSVSAETGLSELETKKLRARNIKKVFSNRLIIIDEVHNIRITDENKNKRVALMLFEVAKYADNLRLLMLSATPMYNTYREIIWITNLLNMVDKRAQITVGDVFDKDGNFVKEQILANGKKIEDGQALLHRKLTGYISYVRGENPYVFPFRVYPTIFSPKNTFIKMDLVKPIEQLPGEPIAEYPKTQLNNKSIELPLKYVDVFMSDIGEYQNVGYNLIIKNMQYKYENKSGMSPRSDIKTMKKSTDIDELPSFENMDSFGYTMLQIPLEALNISYPNPRLDQLMEQYDIGSPGDSSSLVDSSLVDSSLRKDTYNTILENTDPEEILDIISRSVGNNGLANIMTSVDNSNKNPPSRYNFEYRPEIIKRYGPIYKQENIRKYSNKIAEITGAILKSTGLILVYSQYIDGGIVPLGLALEEMGLSRYSTTANMKSLFKTPCVDGLKRDAVTMKTKAELPDKTAFRQARYMMITGDKSFSPNNVQDIKFATDKLNKDGHNIKVLLISKAAAEGLDFKNIRQVHIMEPWYNMNRIEQIIGRAVRNLSHCMLPFEERNVEIYMHSTKLVDADQESADLYVYRLAEKKALQIGQITRLIKETSVDCILNIGQTNFTADKLFEIAENQNIEITLASGPTIKYKVGDNPRTDVCDYMETCEFKCRADAAGFRSTTIQDTTYSTEFAKMNTERILVKIRELFKEQHIYKQEHLINAINIVKQYPLEQIYYTLTYLIKTPNELLLDKYGRAGNLVNRDEYYMFQPLEITDEKSSIYDLSTPVDYKREKLSMELPKEIDVKKDKIMKSITLMEDDQELSTVKYDKLIADLLRNLDIAITVREYTVPQKMWTWYMHTSRILELIDDFYESISVNDIQIYIIEHFLNSLLLHEKMTLVSEIYSGSWSPKHETEEHVKEYFDKRILTSEKPVKKRGIILTKDNQRQIFVQSKADPRIWGENESEDYLLFAPALAKIIVAPKKLQRIVGFFALFNKKEMTFKIKDTSIKNSRGEKCDRAGKIKVIEILNTILEDYKKIRPFDQENTRDITQMGLCVLIEIITQDLTKKDPNRVWFLTTEQSALIKFSELNI